MFRSTLIRTTAPVRRPQVIQRGLQTIKGPAAYTATAIASGDGWNGEVALTSPDVKFDCRMAKEMGGTGEGRNPEQFVALGHASCFLGSLQYVAAQQKKSKLVENAKVYAHVSVGDANRADGGYAFHVKLEVEGCSDLKLVQDADKFCPISRALTDGIKVDVGLI